jgi:hypothetical protein
MKYTRMLLLSCSVFLAGCCEVLGAECEEDRHSEKASGTVLGKVGCYAASYSTATGYGTRVGTSLGNPHHDQKMGEEVAIQRTFFNGVPANVWILYESSPQQKNAYATPDGHILFGYHMFSYLTQSYNELAVAGVLAHEWGHRTQFVLGWSTGNPGMELEADAFSGYYMALAKQWAWSQIQGYFANTYTSGDYNFNHPQHHGTPQQRLAAAYLGVNTAIQAMQRGRPFSYQELHTIFSQQIGSRVIAAAREQRPDSDAANEVLESVLTELNQLELEEIAAGRSRGSEVRYPSKLDFQGVRRLRPFDDTQAGGGVSLGYPVASPF